MNTRWTGFAATLCVLGFLTTTSAHGQSLAEAAAKEKERRKKAGTADSGSPAEASGAKTAAPASAATETHSESWWRSHARTCREAVADAEAQVKYYEARIEEVLPGIRQPQPGDALPPVPPTRVATDAEKREAEASLAAAQKQLAAARKQMEDLEDQARREQVLPEWLR